MIIMQSSKHRHPGITIFGYDNRSNVILDKCGRKQRYEFSFKSFLNQVNEKIKKSKKRLM